MAGLCEGGNEPPGSLKAMKDEVYRTSVTDIAELRGRMYEAIGLVTPEMLSRMWQEIEYRLDIARATNGAHIEVYNYYISAWSSIKVFIVPDKKHPKALQYK
ncbi:hypothetical protein ANN_00338 [Periplaneta americana]|uniref:Uncharacterized protein n=1 Tax=Periplaneta americana TaxID=6978 RepID=A0ABQ8TQH6_PERAM|nr:hypothetical protein ANN_00338 [Periplaneta americana]